MEKQGQKTNEVVKKVPKEKEKELEDLKKELANLRELKKKKESTEKSETQEEIAAPEEQEVKPEVAESENIEDRLNKIEDFLTTQLGEIDQTAYTQHAEQIETELHTLEEEIVGEKGLIEKELSPYEKLLNEYPWLEEKRFAFMYTIPDKKQDPSDYESWRGEWAKVLFDYAKFAIIHIIYFRKIHTEKPFSNFQNREAAIKEIAEELIDQKLAKWLSKNKDSLRIYWKTLDIWAEEIYEWAYESGKLEPILMFEIREAKQEFSTLPKEEVEEIFKKLAKERKGIIIKTDDGQLALKIEIE